MWQKRVLPLLLPLLGVGIFGGLLVATVPSRIDNLKSTYQLYAPPPLANIRSDILNILLLGHKPIYDDFISIYLLQTLMQENVKKEEGPLMEQIRSVIRHEPRLETTYMLSCFVMLLEVKHPEHCREINEAGLRAFPMSWRLLMTQAYVEYSAMNHPAQAASFFLMAARTPNAPPYVLKAAEKLLSTKELTEKDLASSMQVISDNEINKQFKQMLDKIQSTKAMPPLPTIGPAPVEGAAGQAPETSNPMPH